MRDLIIEKLLAFMSAYSTKAELKAAEKTLKLIPEPTSKAKCLSWPEYKDITQTPEEAMIFHLFELAVYADPEDAQQIFGLFSRAISKGFGRAQIASTDKQCERCKLFFEINHCSSRCADENRTTHEFQDRANADEWVHQLMGSGAITAYAPPRGYSPTWYTYAEQLPKKENKEQ